MRTSKISANKPSLVAERLNDFHYSNNFFFMVISVFATSYKVVQNVIILLADKFHTQLLHTPQPSRLPNRELYFT